MLPSLHAHAGYSVPHHGRFSALQFPRPNGELVGFNVDLAKRICAEVNVACTIQAWPWDQAANALADSQGDALIAGLAMTAENGARFDFSSTYLALPGRFVTRADDLAGFSPVALTDKRSRCASGSAHAAFLTRYLPGLEASVSTARSAALEAVQDRLDADAFFGDAMRASFWLNENLGCCGFAGEAYFRPNLFGDGLTIAVPAGHDRCATPSTGRWCAEGKRRAPTNSTCAGSRWDSTRPLRAA